MDTQTIAAQEHDQVVQPARRRIYNPVQKDYATFLASSAETNGAYSLAEVELAPGGGNHPHYHTAFTERFEVLEGGLQVLLGKERRMLKPGETATVQPNTLHCFANPTAQPSRFLVELRPGHTGFEQAIQIAYGLATDGKTNKDGLPTNLYHLALLLTLGESKLPGLFGLLLPLFNYLAARARKLGIEQELIEKYCQ